MEFTTIVCKILTHILCLSVIALSSTVKRETAKELQMKLRKLHLEEQKQFAHLAATEENEKVLSRRKRTVVAWPEDSIFISEFAFEIPIEAPDGVDVPFLIEVPYIFDLPAAQRVFWFQNPRDNDRVDIYGTLASIFKRFGMNGEECVLRAICERSAAHFLTGGLLGEVINLIMAASSGNGGEEMYRYLEAEYIGNAAGNCSSTYSDCPLSLFQWLET